MKKTVLFITALLLMGSTAGAQGLLGRLGERAKNAVEENIGNKVEQGVNDILNGKKKDKKRRRRLPPRMPRQILSREMKSFLTTTSPMSSWASFRCAGNCWTVM